MWLNRRRAISRSVEVDKSFTSQQRSTCTVEDSRGRSTGRESGGRSRVGKYITSETVMVF